MNTEWKKASRSSQPSNNCVEIGFLDGVPRVRDSKHTSQVMTLTAGDFEALKQAARTELGC